MARWWWKADYVETCNCAHGCPCNFTQIPTDGTCRGVAVWEVREGACDGVRLDGLRVGFIEHWPNPIHKGNGTCIIVIDERADPAQRAALESIAKGEAGDGGPFALFATTLAAPATVLFGPVRLEREGKRVEMALADLAQVRVGPIKEDLGGEANARLVLPTGFIFTDGDIVNTESCTVNAPGLRFSNRDTSAFYAQVAYNC